MTMKLNDYIVCCSWHKPRNAIVKMKTGEVVPAEALRRIKDSPSKDNVIHSGGICDECARRLLKGREPLLESTLAARDAPATRAPGLPVS
jgi:hypothetical protein